MVSERNHQIGILAIIANVPQKRYWKMVMMIMIMIAIIVITALLLADRRNSFLKHSRLSVVAFLNELPQTKHELTSFTVDVNLALVSGCNHILVIILEHVFSLYCYHCLIQWKSSKYINLMSYVLTINSSVNGTSRLTFAYRPVSWRLQASTLQGF